MGDKDISAYGLQYNAPRSGHADMWNRQYVPVMPVSSLALASRRVPRDVPKRVMYCCAPVAERLWASLVHAWGRGPIGLPACVLRDCLQFPVRQIVAICVPPLLVSSMSRLRRALMPTLL